MWNGLAFFLRLFSFFLFASPLSLILPSFPPLPHTPFSLGLSSSVSLPSSHSEYFERAEKAEGELKILQTSLTQAEDDFQQRKTAYDEEIKKLQDSVDPIKNARVSAMGGGMNAMNSEEIESLRKECESLRSQLRDAKYAATSSSGAVPAAEAAKFQDQLRDGDKKNQELKEQLRDAHAEIAKLKALSSSGADRNAATQQLTQQLEKSIEEERSRAREAKANVEALTGQLQTERSTSKRLQAELDSIKASLDNQLKQLETAGGQAKSTEAQLQMRQQELSQERSARSAEQAAHEETRKQLSVTQGDLVSWRVGPQTQGGNNHRILFL